MLLSNLIADFIEDFRYKHASPLTIRDYSYYLKHFLEFSGDIDPKAIDLNLVQKYKQHLLQKPLQTATQNYFMIALRSFLRYLSDRRIPVLPFKQIELEKHELKPVEILTDEQLNLLLNAPDASKKEGLRDKAILETLFITGLKVSDLVALNRNFCNLSSSTSSALARYLSMRKDTFTPLFIRFQGEVTVANNGEAMRLTPRSVQRIVEKYVKKVGLSVKATPKTFRHLFKNPTLRVD